MAQAISLGFSVHSREMGYLAWFADSCAGSECGWKLSGHATQVLLGLEGFFASVKGSGLLVSTVPLEYPTTSRRSWPPSSMARPWRGILGRGD